MRLNLGSSAGSDVWVQGTPGTSLRLNWSHYWNGDENYDTSLAGLCLGLLYILHKSAFTKSGPSTRSLLFILPVTFLTW